MAALDSISKNENLTQTPNKPRNVNVLIKLGALVASGLIVGGVIDKTRTTHVEQPETVQPYDTAWTLVRRAENDAGIDTDSVDMRPAVDRVVEQYGTTLQPGQKIEVTLDK